MHRKQLILDRMNTEKTRVRAHDGTASWLRIGVVFACVLSWPANANAETVSVAVCKDKQVFGLARGDDYDQAIDKAMEQCVRRGGSHACCDKGLTATGRLGKGGGYQSCAAAIRGPAGTIGGGAGRNRLRAIESAKSNCSKTLSEGSPDRECNSYKTLAILCTISSGL
jgi:hypothetical protein